MLRTVGLLHSGSEASFVDQVNFLCEGLATLNYWTGEDDAPEGYEAVTLQAEWANNSLDLLDTNAQKLGADANVEVIVAAGGPQSALAAQKYASDKNIVFTTVVDPVALGWSALSALPAR